MLEGWEGDRKIAQVQICETLYVESALRTYCSAVLGPLIHMVSATAPNPALERRATVRMDGFLGACSESMLRDLATFWVFDSMLDAQGSNQRLLWIISIKPVAAYGQ